MSVTQQFKIHILASKKNCMVYKGLRNTNQNEDKNQWTINDPQIIWMTRLINKDIRTELYLYVQEG